jgi:putative hemolysin
MNIHELMVQKYLNSVVAGKGGMSRPVLDFMVNDVKLALEKQLVDSRNPDFRLRMSNIGRAYCQQIGRAHV